MRGNDGLWLAYQPIVDIARSGQIVGVEALLRWNRPGHGPVAPIEVIPVAEQSGLITELGNSGHAAGDQRPCAMPGGGEPYMAINLCARQFSSPELVDDLRACLAEYDVEPARVSLEITETVAMGNAESTLATMGDLKSVGVRLAIDDFGTGFSSLGYLKRSPADTVKIDCEFIGNVATASGDRAIVTAVLSMAEALDLEVVAEGVETVQQRDALAALGCRRAQGFLFARPAPIGAIVPSAG